ncbi:MAG: threonine synthase, partial [Saprospiraceae bacterium]
MQFFSTNNPDLRVGLEEAVFKGLPDDNGLFMPTHISQVPANFINDLKSYTFPELAFVVAKTFLDGAIPDADLKTIIELAINFPAPLVQLDAHSYLLELTHGPSLAFKDFGARFMAEMMAYLNQDRQREI